MPTISRHTDGSYLSLAILAGGRRRELVVGRWVAAATCLSLMLTIVWSLLAGFYVVFHDQLVAGLMSRQADMQYAYEDQVATLRTELDRTKSGSLISRGVIETALRDLNARSDRLEVRAEAIDKLIEDGLLTLPRGRTAVGYADNPDGSTSVSHRPAETHDLTLPSAALDPAPLRLGADGDHASLDADVIAGRLARVGTQQLKSVMRLRDPLSRATHRLTSALAQAGLSRRVLARGARDVGGPFVPLPTSERASDLNDFDVEVAKTREALEQRGRILALVDQVPLLDPLDGPIDVSSSFGARVDPFVGRPSLHTGIDLRQTASDAVHATAAGVVTAAGPNGGYGNMVEIDHGNGLVTRYAHLSAVDVIPRQRVATGAVIGRVGSSGRSTGPHLHYETRIDGEPVDPATFLIAGSRLASE